MEKERKAMLYMTIAEKSTKMTAITLLHRCASGLPDVLNNFKLFEDQGKPNIYETQVSKTVIPFATGAVLA